jgi:MFS family permease
LNSSRDRDGANSARSLNFRETPAPGSVTDVIDPPRRGAVILEPPPAAPEVARPEAGEEWEQPTGIWRTFDSLRDSNYRWFFGSMFAHFAAMNIQMFIQGYLVFQLSGSYAYLGMISLAQGLPMLAFALFGGVIADQVPKKKYVVQVGQAVNAVNAFIVATWLFTDLIVVEHLLVAAFIQGTVNSLMMPSRQALTPEVVGFKRLTNALALSTAGMNFNRLTMPAFAGFGLALINPNEGVPGTEWVYVAIGCLFVAAVVFMFPVTSAARPSRGRRSVAGAVADLKEGFAYMRRTPTVQSLLIVNLLIVSASMPYFQLLPGFAEDVLGAGKSELSVLISIQGIGSLGGSLFIASLPNRGRGKLMLMSSLLLGGSLILFSASSSYWLTAAILIIVGVGQSGRMSLSNVLVQSYSADEYRGRVMSIYMMEFGLTMIGTFFVGVLAATIGPQWAIGITAAWLCVLVTYLLLRSQLARLD